MRGSCRGTSARAPPGKVPAGLSEASPKGPCTHIAYTLGPMCLYREYFKANVYTILVHGALGINVYARALKDPLESRQNQSDNLLQNPAKSEKFYARALEKFLGFWGLGFAGLWFRVLTLESRKSPNPPTASLHPCRSLVEPSILKETLQGLRRTLNPQPLP